MVYGILCPDHTCLTPQVAASQTMVCKSLQLDRTCLRTSSCFSDNGLWNLMSGSHLSNTPSCCISDNGLQKPTPGSYLSERLQLLVLLALLLLTTADGEVGIRILILLQHLHRPCWQNWASTTPLYSHMRLVHALTTPEVRQSKEVHNKSKAWLVNLLQEYTERLLPLEREKGFYILFKKRNTRLVCFRI